MPASAFKMVWKIMPSSITTRMPRPIPITRQANIMERAPSIQVWQILLPLKPPITPAMMPMARKMGAISLANQSISRAP